MELPNQTTPKIEVLPLEIKVEQQKRAEELFGMFQTVSVAPTAAPLNFLNQIQVYTNGSTYRLYWYDKTNKTWHYINATA